MHLFKVICIVFASLAAAKASIGHPVVFAPAITPFAVAPPPLTLAPPVLPPTVFAAPAPVLPAPVFPAPVIPAPVALPAAFPYFDTLAFPAPTYRAIPGPITKTHHVSYGYAFPAHFARQAAAPHAHIDVPHHHHHHGHLLSAFSHHHH